MTAIISAHELWRRYGEGEVAVEALAGVTVELSIPGASPTGR